MADDEKPIDDSETPDEVTENDTSETVEDEVVELDDTLAAPKPPPPGPVPDLTPAPEPIITAAPEKQREPSRLEVYFPRKSEGEREAIHVASFPAIMYFWPTIAMFFVCGLLQSWEWVAPGTLGWMAIGTFALNVLVIVQDFDQKKFVILILFLVALGLGAWIVNIKGYVFLQKFLSFLYDLQPTLSTSAYLLFGFMMAILFFWGMLRPLFDYWRLEHNEFVHYIQPFGRDLSIPRSGSTVSKGIPDILEFILTFGGGSLIIRREGEVVATIPHIPFLGRRMKVIEKMLSEQRVTTYDK